MPETTQRPGTGNPGAQQIDQIGPILPAPYDTTAGLSRRREAALRLPPLSCGCHDPATSRHQAGRCRWRRKAAA